MTAMGRSRAIVAVLLFFGLTSVGPLWAQATSQENLSPFRDCQEMSEDDFRTFIGTTAAANLRSAIATLDMDALVSAEWNRLALGVKYKEIVSNIIEEERQNEGYFRKLFANYHPGTAEEMATHVVSRVFNSPAFTDLSESLGNGVAETLAATTAVKNASMDSQTTVATCLESFLSVKYTSTIADFFKQSVPSLDVSKLTNPSAIERKTIINVGLILAAVMAVIMRRLIARIIRSVVARIVGRVSVRLLAWFTGIGGGILLLWDIMSGGSGPFPMIKEEMTSYETQSQIISSFATDLRTGMDANIDSAAFDTATQLFGQYLDFKQSYETLLILTETDQRVKEQVGNLTQQEMVRVAEVVDLIEASSGKDGVATAFQRGLVRRALTLPEEGMVIARDTKSMAVAFEWQAKVPTYLGAVVENGLHRALSPEAYSPEELTRIIGLPGGNPTIQKIILLPGEQMRSLLALPEGAFAEAAASLSLRELGGLAALSSGLPTPEMRVALVRIALASEVGRKLLGDADFQSAFLASIGGDPGPALAALEERSWWRTPAHAQLMFAGDISFGYFRQLYPWVLWVAAGAVMLIGLMLFRLFRPPVRVVIERSSAEEVR